jgi:hypothetical protein
MPAWRDAHRQLWQHKGHFGHPKKCQLQPIFGTAACRLVCVKYGESVGTIRWMHRCWLVHAGVEPVHRCTACWSLCLCSCTPAGGCCAPAAGPMLYLLCTVSHFWLCISRGQPFRCVVMCGFGYRGSVQDGRLGGVGCLGVVRLAGTQQCHSILPNIVGVGGIVCGAKLTVCVDNTVLGAEDAWHSCLCWLRVLRLGRRNV